MWNRAIALSVAAGWFFLFVLITQTHEYVLTQKMHVVPFEAFLTYLRDKHYLTVILGTVVADLFLGFSLEYIFFGESGLNAKTLFFTLFMIVFAITAVIFTYVVEPSMFNILTAITLSILIVTKAIDYQKPKNVKITKF